MVFHFEVLENEYLLVYKRIYRIAQYINHYVIPRIKLLTMNTENIGLLSMVEGIYNNI